MGNRKRTYAVKFRKNKCTFCGQCFHRCPVMKLPLEEARAEMKRIIKGEKTHHVLQECSSCHSCNIICPEQANPAALILDRWHELFQKEGMPARALYFTPHNKHNFRTYTIERLPEDEKKLLAKWNDHSPCKEILYPGCNVITVPYLTMTKLFDGIEIRGSLDLCCGEMYYRTGHFDQLREVASRLTQYYKKMKLRKMLIPCTAGKNLFTNVLPAFGAKFDFEVVHILPWIYDQLNRNKLIISHPLNMTVTLHDSCHGKAFGDEYMDLPRRILEKCGAVIKEQEYIRDMKLCCGIGGGFSHHSSYHPYTVTKATYRALASSHKPHADAVAVYCAGCLQQLSVGQLLNPLRNIPIYHILELVQLATGEKPERRIKSRARLLLSGIIRHQFPSLLSGKRYTMPCLEKIEQIKQGEHYSDE